MLLVLLPFMVGVAVGYRWHPDSLPCLLALCLLVAAAAVMTFLHRIERHTRSLFVLTMALAFALCGALTEEVRNPLNRSDHYLRKLPDKGSYTLQVRLDETPAMRTRSLRACCVVERWLYNDTSETCSGKLMLYLIPDSNAMALHSGDRLLITTEMRPAEGAENPYQFDYRHYLQRRGIVRCCFLADGHWQRYGPPDSGLTAWIHRLQERLVERFRQSDISPEHQGVAEAMLLGWRGGIDPATLTRFRDAGVVHLLCVSGLHVGIVAALVGSLLGFLRRGRWHWLRALLQLAAVWLFVLVSNMAPATVRAAFMFSLLIVAHLSGRQNTTVNTLAVALLITLLVQPSLMFDVGVQLSYAAVLGIALLYNPMKQLINIPEPGYTTRHFEWRRLLLWLPRTLWELTCLSTAAQLATLPFTLYHFHQAPIAFLPANLTLVPLATLLLATMILLLVVQPIVLLGRWVGWLLEIELRWVDSVTGWVQAQPWAVIDHVYCDLTVALLTAAAVGMLVLALQRRHWIWTGGTAACCLAITTYMGVTNLHATRQQCWIAYAQRGHTAIELFDGRNSLLLLDPQSYADSIDMDYVSGNLLTMMRTRHRLRLPFSASVSSPSISVHGRRITFGGERIAIVDRTLARWIRMQDKQGKAVTEAADWIIITDNVYAPLGWIASHFRCNHVVLTAANSYRYNQAYQQEALHLGWHCINLREQPAEIIHCKQGDTR